MIKLWPEEMKPDMDEYLSAGTDVAAEGETKSATLDFLLRRMRHKSDFPALSDSILAINRLTSSNSESIDTLATSLLKDFGLTNRILRLVNSAHFRQAGAGSINTITRAIVVLGFNALRNIVITVLLFEHLRDKGNARELKEGFLHANMRGMLGREVALQLKLRAPEESYIYSMFHGLGELLTQFYFPEESVEVRKLLLRKELTKESASAMILGLSYEELGVAVAKTWGFPTAMVSSMRSLPAIIRKPISQDEMLHMISGFSHALCEIVSGAGPNDYHQAVRKLTERFEGGLSLSDKQVKGLVETSLKAVSEIAAVLHIDLNQSPLARRAKNLVRVSAIPMSKAARAERTLLDDTTLGDQAMLDIASVVSSAPVSIAPAEMILEGLSVPVKDIDAVPENAQEVLMAGIQDIGNSLLEDFSLNDVLRITLETMYRAMGFQRVILCLRNPKTNYMIGRFGFGQEATEVAKQLNFSLEHSNDVFLMAMTKSVDLLIGDVDDPKIAERIPAWYRERIFAKTFVLFPLVIKTIPVGLIYCEREEAGSIVIPAKELTLLKTLRNQALIAIKQSTSE